jgi:hypothetical protein
MITGHSFGGLVPELLLDRGLAAAAISPVQVKGVLRLPPAQRGGTFPVLRNPANRNRRVGLTPKQFDYNFTNAMAEDEAKAVYDRFHVPGLGKSEAVVDYKEFPGRPHFAGAPGWEAVADYALDWADDRTGATAPA